MDTSRIDAKLDKIQEEIAAINTTLAVNTAHLGEHMRRTDALERRVDSFWQKALIAVSILGGVLSAIKILVT